MLRFPLRLQLRTLTFNLAPVISKQAFSSSALVKQNAARLQTCAMKRRQNEDASTRISKDMSKVLRHKPPPGAMDAAGWVNLPVLLRHLKNQPTEQQVREIVAACPKVGAAHCMSLLANCAPSSGGHRAARAAALPRAQIASATRGLTKPLPGTPLPHTTQKRFVLDDTTNPPRIRAAQGHSVELEEAVLEPVTEASQVPVPVHVTGVDG